MLILTDIPGEKFPRKHDIEETFLIYKIQSSTGYRTWFISLEK